MAFQSNGPVTLGLPAFRGFTRRVVLAALCVCFGQLLLGLVSSQALGTLMSAALLEPEKLWPQLWRAATYSFVLMGIWDTALALLSVWMIAMPLEEERGSMWLREYFFVATIGGGVLACVVAKMVGRFVPGLDPAIDDVATGGLWPAVMALVLAFGVLFAEREIYMLVFRMKAKYMAAIWLLIYLALTLGGHQRFGPLTALCAAGCGYAYLKMAPRRGLGWAGSEMWFGWRNAYYRAKRRRAAKKFTVYMKKQGKDVNIDEDGRYVDPSGKPRDPNDRRWMN